MSIVQPAGVVHLLRGVPLDPSQEHTLYFTSQANQKAYFSSMAVSSWSGVSYIRTSAGTVKIQGNIEDYLNCNYMYFSNNGFSTKTIFAFIKKINYINNITFEVEFEIDEIQTWLIEIINGLKECYVIREHAVTDSYIDNTEQEDVPIGIREKDTIKQTIDFNYMKAYYLRPRDSATSYPTPDICNYISGVYISEDYNIAYSSAFGNDESGILWDGIYGGIGVNDTIALKLMPSHSSANFILRPITGYHGNGFVRTTDFNIPLYTGQINGYTPINSKCFSNQFYKITITNADGEQNQLSLDDFLVPLQATQTFKLVESMDVEPSICLYPTNFRYAGVNYNQGISLGAMPTCALTKDNYRDYISQHQNSLRIQQMTMAMNSMQSIGSGGWSAAPGVISNVAGYVANMEDLKLQPNSVSGLANSNGNMKSMMQMYKFTIRVTAPDYASIERIDKFFTMYGYRTNKVKVPNISSRPYYNYTKTMNCKIVGNMPADAIAKVQNYFNAGITFWKNASVVGNYSVNNQPT